MTALRHLLPFSFQRLCSLRMRYWLWWADRWHWAFNRFGGQYALGQWIGCLGCTQRAADEADAAWNEVQA